MKLTVSGRMLCALIVAGLVAGAARPASAADVFNMPKDPYGKDQTNLDLVSVGDKTNLANTNGLGSVGYDYQIGKFAVTVGQYLLFLNSVARNDPYRVYNGNPGIAQTGTPGNYSYSMVTSMLGTPTDKWANRPVTGVTWGDAARFCNWLANGQPSGMLTGNPASDKALTEDGSYSLNGATGNAALLSITRKSQARYVIPTVNEWYKAAYYDPTKSGGPGYWAYATRNDTKPTRDGVPGGTNSANYYTGIALEAPYNVTEAGAYTNSYSYYGTFDQNGNVYQWTEEILPFSDYRVLRGGSWRDGWMFMRSNTGGFGQYPSASDDTCGFRVVLLPESAPEPTTLAILAIGGGMLLRRRRAQA